MARSTFGQLQEGQAESEMIAAYLEQTSIYIQANSIAEEKLVAVFLSVIGGKNYSTVSQHQTGHKTSLMRTLLGHSWHTFTQS